MALESAATLVFAEKGFDGARVEEIARRARANKAMISYHFGGKAGRYRAMLTDTFATAMERLEPLRDGSRPADERLREFIARFADVVAGRPGLPAMLLREALSGGRHLDRDTIPHFLAVFSLVREVLERGVEEGTFRPVDPLLTHLALIGGLVFFFGTAPFRQRILAEGRVPAPPPTGTAFVAHLQDLMTRALTAASPAAAAGGAS